MSDIKQQIDESLRLDESAEKVRNELIGGSLGNLRSKISGMDIQTEIQEKKVVVKKVEPKYDKLQLADTAADIYRSNINPPTKPEVEAHKPIATPETIASRANVVALSRALAGQRSCGNDGKTSPVGPNGTGNLGKYSPSGDGGLGNVGTNTVSGNYYALTTDMTLEQYQEYVDESFAGLGSIYGQPSIPKGEKKEKCKADCECKKCSKKKNEDVVLDLQQKLVALGSADWMKVDQVLREVSEEHSMRPKDVSRAFRAEHGIYPDKWIKENLEQEVVGIMPLEEAARINKVGQVYEVTFMFRGGTQRLKFFWPQVGKPTREQMQNAVELFWPKARLITFYPSMDAGDSNQMVMVPPQTNNYVALHKEHWNQMSKRDSKTFYTICEEEGEPLGSPEENEDGTYQVHIIDHDTGEERVVFFGEGYKPVNQAKVDAQIGKAADEEAIEKSKSKKYGRDDKKIDKLYKRQQAMRFSKKMSDLGEAAYPGHDEQGNPLPKTDKRMEVNAADKKANTPAYQKMKAGDKRYKAGDSLTQD